MDNLMNAENQKTNGSEPAPVRPENSNKVDVVVSPSMYIEVTLSSILSAFLIVFFLLRDVSDFYSLGNHITNIVIISLFLTGFCFINTVIKIIVNFKHLEASFIFVSIFLTLLPLILIFLPDAGVIEGNTSQYYDTGRGEWKG